MLKLLRAVKIHQGIGSQTFFGQNIKYSNHSFGSCTPNSKKICHMWTKNVWVFLKKGQKCFKSDYRI